MPTVMNLGGRHRQGVLAGRTTVVRLTSRRPYYASYCQYLSLQARSFPDGQLECHPSHGWRAADDVHGVFCCRDIIGQYPTRWSDRSEFGATSSASRHDCRSTIPENLVLRAHVAACIWLVIPPASPMEGEIYLCGR